MARILVLGGTGFVGPFIVRQLLEEGHNVTVFHRGHREPPGTERAQHVHGEFANLPAYVSRLSQHTPEVVIDVSPGIGKSGHGVLHFAGVAERGIVLTSMDVYRAMQVLWGVSSQLQPMPVTEDSALRDEPSPDLPPDLAFDNLTVEQAVRDQADFPVTVLRCPFIYGPLDTKRRLRAYVRRMLDRRPAIVLDQQFARLQWSRGYVENIAAAAVAAVSNDRAAGKTYNVAEPDALTEDQWVHTIADAFGWSGRVVVAEPDALPPELRVPLPPQDLFADTSRIRDELGYHEHVLRSEGVRRAIEWEMSHGENESRPDYSAEDAFLASGSWPRWNRVPVCRLGPRSLQARKPLLL
jgi:nucleoside-diphosphate-sugar epimerase